MRHLIVDFETMGQNVFDCAIIDCSVIIVDTEKMISDNPYKLNDISLVKKFKLSIKDQVDNYKWIVYKDTIDFWLSQPDHIKKNIKPLSSDLLVKDFVEQFLLYLINNGKVQYWWSRSNTFDPLLLWRLFNSQNRYTQMNEYLPYWRIRDIRTFIDAKLDFPKKNGFVPIIDQEKWERVFIEHDSTWDVFADALRMQAILRAEKDLEMIE
jgi:hypothetical protein